MALIRVAVSLMLAAAATTVCGQTLTAEMIDSMGNNSLFTRWRPRSHFIAPSGWMNDPCGPLYDPVGKLYHMQYQFHPDHVNWGNISWGHATSPDLITWTDVDHFPDDDLPAWEGNQAEAIGTTNISSNHHDPPLYNHLGIWSGTANPVNLTGEVDGTLLAFYTSVSYLPTSWDAAYTHGTESQSYALSYDGGIHWEQYPDNPVISYPPGNWNVTGWRDPFFHSWPELDALLGQTEPHYYVIFGSGIHGLGPRMPLYSTPASNLTAWEFLGALWEPAGNTSLGSLFETGSYGFNFEVPNFYSLDGHWFVSTGVQGGSVTFHEQNWAIWNEGTVSVRSNGSVEFHPISGGAVDWGILYAITSFNDTKNNRRIQIGWAYDQMDDVGLLQAGYNGALSLPRELSVKYTSGVMHNATDTEPGNSVYTQDSNGTWTARTLGVAAASDVVAGLRGPATYSSYDGKSVSLGSSFSNTYELVVTINSTTGVAGVTIAESPEGDEYTKIYFDPSNYTIMVDKTHSSLITEFPNASYVGYFEPYMYADGPEPIVLDIFLDGSLLEVYANGRFSLTTRIYPSREDSTGISLLVGEGAEVVFGGIEIWDDLLAVWPSRPINSSSLLVFDTPAETDNYTWWAGN